MYISIYLYIYISKYLYIYGALWGPRVPIYGALWGPRVPGPRVPGLRVPGPRGPGLTRDQGGSQGDDFPLVARIRSRLALSTRRPTRPDTTRASDFLDFRFFSLGPGTLGPGTLSPGTLGPWSMSPGTLGPHRDP